MLTVIDLAKRWGVSTKTIYRMLESGKLKGTKIAGQWRFRRQYIERKEIEK